MNSGQPPPEQPTDATVTGEFSGRFVEPGTIIAGRYRLDRLIGMGAMGQVFQVHDLHLDTTVAGKLLRPDLAADERALYRFRQELLLARKISHPNVIRLHDMVQDGVWWLITMDYVEGRTLQEVLDEGPLPLETALDYTLQLARGLEAAHAVGVIHRDLKPANVLVGHDGRLLISDFGIARSLSQAGLTRQGVVVGTLDYLSPEQAAGEAVDGRSDLYTLGIILSEMLTGKLPFSARTASEAVSQRLARSPRPLADRDDCPGWLKDACHRLLASDPTRRYQSARELIDALRQVPAGRASSPWKRALPAAALVLLAASAGWYLTRGPSETAQPGTSGTPREDRYFLLPTTHQAGHDAEAWALAGWLTDALREGGELKLQDRLQTWEVVDKLMIPLSELSEHLAALDSALPERRGLSIDWDADRNRLSLSGLDAEARQVLSGPLAIDAPLPQAMETLIDRLSARGLASPPGGLPGEWPAIVAFYRGLRELDRGESIAATEPLEVATGSAPDSSAAWWALSQAYKLQGMADASMDAALKARRLAEGQGRYAVLARAAEAEASGRIGESIELLQELLERHPHAVAPRLWLAELLADSGQLEQAIAMSQEALEIDPDRIRGWYLLGKYSIMIGDSQRALDDYLTQGLVRSKRQSARQAEGDLINAMGVAYDQLGALEEATEQYRAAEAMRQEIGDRRGRAATLRNLAAIESFSGSMEQAERYLAQARSILEELGEQSALADLYNDEGILAEENGQYERALGKYREALRIRQQLANDHKRAESLSNVGYAFYQLGQYDNADAYWQEALDHYREANNEVGRAHLLQQLALLQWVRGDWEAALELLETSEHLAVSMQMHEEQAVTRGLVAQLRLSQGDMEQARGAADRASEGFQQRADLRGLTEMALIRAEIDLLDGRVEAAGAELDELDEAPLNLEQRAKLADLRARIALAAHDFEQAAEASGSAVELAEASGSLAVVGFARATRLLVDSRTSGFSASAWEDAIAAARDSGHVPRLLRVLAMALTEAAENDPDAARRWLTDHWPLLSREAPYRQQSKVLELARDLCPLGSISCEEIPATGPSTGEQDPSP